MSKLVKAIGLIYLIGLIVLMSLLPISAICVLAKLVGAPISWTGACIPVFIALGVAVPVIISKILIDYWTEA